MSGSKKYDIAIVGTGPVACALVTALARRGLTRALRIALIGPHRAHTPIDPSDPRAIALSYGSRILLDHAWPAHAVPIHQIQVSQKGYFGRATLDREDCKLPALGYVLRYSALLHTLAQSAQAHLNHLQHLHGPETPGWLAMSAGAPIQDKQGVTLPLTPLTEDSSQTRKEPTSLHAQLVIYAEGSAPSALSQNVALNTEAASAIKLDHSPQNPTTPSTPSRHIHHYHQTALIGIVRASAPQPHTAWERFTAEGPLALLPLGGPNEADYALVWCSTPDIAKQRLEAPAERLLAELDTVFGGRMGKFIHVQDRTCFPLTLQKQHRLTNHRIAAIGNAAQTLHPVAGQGLNLGLRDAWVLAQSLQKGPTPEALAHFAKHRQTDRETTIHTTHTLANAFISSGLSPLPTLYSAGLTLLDHLPPLKTAFANQMIFGSR